MHRSADLDDAVVRQKPAKARGHAAFLDPEKIGFGCTGELQQGNAIMGLVSGERRTGLGVETDDLLSPQIGDSLVEGSTRLLYDCDGSRE